MTKDRRRILVVAEYGVLNGGERSFLSVANLLQQAGWELQLLVPTPSEFQQRWQALGCESHSFVKSRQHQRMSQRELREQIADCVQTLHPAIIHANSLATGRLCGPVARELGCPSVACLRDIIKLSQKAVADLNANSRLIAVSNATRDWHLRQGIDAAKTTVIFNGVDSDQFAPDRTVDDSIAAELNFDPASPIVLFVGQIGMRKGVDLLIEAFRKILSAVPDARLLIVGERNSIKTEAIEFEQRCRLESKVGQLSRHVHWLNRRNDVAELMRQASLLIHPARQEPLGRVLLEASMSGLPIVTTNVGGSAEILEGLEPWGMLVDPDAESIANRAIDLLSSPTNLGQISRQLREMALRRFGTSQCATSLNRCYRQLV